MNNYLNRKRVIMFLAILLFIILIISISGGMKNNKKDNKININSVVHPTSTSDVLPDNVVLTTSSDNNLVVFTKTVGNTLRDEAGIFDYNELWLSNLKTGEEQLLVKGGPVDPLDLSNAPYEIYNINSATFSNDNNIVYFLAGAYTTSDALFSINLAENKIKFIGGSNYLKVIRAGKYKDNIITNQHRYYDSGGSYDYFYITDPETGRDIKVIGNNLDESIN